MAPRLRRPTTADLDEILALMNDPASPHRQVACRHGEALEKASQLYERLSEDDNLVLDDEGEILAYASWQVYDRHAHLNVLSVAGGRQRGGLGRQLFEAFRAALREDGIESYTLRAFADSPWALAFYEKLGLAPYSPATHGGPRPQGFERYLAMAVAQNEWPAPHKVLYFEALAPRS